MKKIIEKCLIITALLALNFLSDCKEEEVPANEENTLIDKYTLEIDNNNIIYKVSLSSFDSRQNYIIEYVYSQGSIIVTVTYSGEPGTRVTIFHIDNSGFADSSHYSLYHNGAATIKQTSYFLYDLNNYLKMMIVKRTDSYANQTPDTTFYDYNNGNLIKSAQNSTRPYVSFPTSRTYTYNSIKNFIDIYSFNGAFVGILNQNLIESITSYGSPEGVHCGKYQYTLNPNGLVEERKRLNCFGQTDVIRIDKFEYKIR